MDQKKYLPFLILGVFYPISIFAQVPELKHGMGFYEVLKSLGAPQEKMERESQRQEVWIYPQRKIIFQEGKVVAWSDAHAQKPPEKPSTALVDAKTQNDPKQVESLLGEILSDLNTKPAAAPAPEDPKKDD